MSKMSHFFRLLPKTRQRTIARLCFKNGGTSFQKKWKYPAKLQAYYHENDCDPYNLAIYFNLKIK